MKEQGFGRRDFLKGAVVGGAAAATATTNLALPQSAQAQQPRRCAGRRRLLVPEHRGSGFRRGAGRPHGARPTSCRPKGTDIGINVYIDRALAGAWGKGDRLYMQGPWKIGVPSQGYQVPLTPAQLYRAGIEATNAHCRKAYGRTVRRT